MTDRDDEKRLAAHAERQRPLLPALTDRDRPPPVQRLDRPKPTPSPPAKKVAEPRTPATNPPGSRAALEHEAEGACPDCGDPDYRCLDGMEYPPETPGG